jgi:hypothetical protein
MFWFWPHKEDTEREIKLVKLHYEASREQRRLAREQEETDRKEKQDLMDKIDKILATVTQLTRLQGETDAEV